MISPRSWATEGTLLKVVSLLAAPDSLAKSILPSPLKLNEEVSRSSFLGKRKTRLQVLPESDEGISKLKTLDTVEVTVPFIAVPGAVSGEEESMGMMRWGNS